MEPIIVFQQAKDITEGQLFIANLGSVEGRTKATLTPIKRVVYIIQEYVHISCEKQHKIGETKDGKPITQKCGQPIRCSRIVREITADRQKAINATLQNSDMSYEEFELN